MQLTVHDRLILLAVIPLGAPQSGNLITMRIVHDLSMSIGFTEGEIEEKQIVIHDDGRATWNEGAPIDVSMGSVALDIIKKGLAAALPQWDKDEALTLAHFSLFEKFGVDMELPEVEEATED